MKSQAGYVLKSSSPVIVHDLGRETRFEPSALLLNEGIVSGITVVVGTEESPFGTLGAHTSRQRDFTQDDVNFLQSMSNVLAAALEHRVIEHEVRELNEQLLETNEKLRVENVDRQMAMGALSEVMVANEQATREAKEAREIAEVANLAKSEFLSRMSHELRTPLNAILGFGQILNKQEMNARGTESIGHILKAGRHLLDLINEVLDISRVEAGHLELSLEPISLADIVPEACALVGPLAAERSVRIHFNPQDSESSPIYVLADGQRLKQVLINLLSNAIKYNREGGQVIVSCERTPSNTVAVAVRDTGMGINASDLPKLFTPIRTTRVRDRGN